MRDIQRAEVSRVYLRSLKDSAWAAVVELQWSTFPWYHRAGSMDRVRMSIRNTLK